MGRQRQAVANMKEIQVPYVLEDSTKEWAAKGKEVSIGRFSEEEISRAIVECQRKHQMEMGYT